ncbi:hypothetical protein K2173_008693 [Erythroxylum novogranatense]|uniref:Uncharacterized protein n=1 Tax=Erythroxylum novogranatense TaxID=1862640 RepID=A0AAV8SLX9_9ROSI|nr:hypothetical protein K2173_008693 [Erythroxylum novogranatense]
MNKVVLPLKWVHLESISRCNNLKYFKKIHAQLITSGSLCDESVVNRVVEFFGGSVDFVESACDFLKHCDWPLSSFPFNRLISCYATSNGSKAAVLVYRVFVRDGFSPDEYSFPPILKSCAKFMGIAEGRQVHGLVVKMGLLSDLYVKNSLVHLYSVCGECSDAGQVFDEMIVRDTVSWTAIVSGYVRAGLFHEALSLFSRMDAVPNVATFINVLVACGRKGCLRVGKRIHGLIFRRALEENIEANNALMDMYVKCECLNEAKQIFDELPVKDVVSWTTIISGLVHCKRPKESLELFLDMQKLGIEPDGIILTSVLSACASLGALDYGRWVHHYIVCHGIQWDIHMGTAIIDMYAKCGCIELALQTFDGMRSKNVQTWNALLNGLAMHGHACEALRLFNEMVRLGMRPNEVTFLSILTACCHSGLVDEGRHYFHQMMSDEFKLHPRLEHYGCMVDMLCRAGLLDEVLKLIKGMDMEPDVLIIGTLLSACKVNEVGELSLEILDQLVELDSHDSGVYVLLSNIYASHQRWAEVARIRMLQKEKGIKKDPGLSVIEVDGRAYEFHVGESSHSPNNEVHLLLNFLSKQIFLAGRHEHCFLR